MTKTRDEAEIVYQVCSDHWTILAKDFRDGGIRNFQFKGDLRGLESRLHQFDDQLTPFGGYGWSSHFYSPSFCCSHSRLHPLGDQLALELGDGREDVQLEVSSRVSVGGVDSLAGTHQCHPVRLKFCDDLSKVTEGPGYTVELEGENDVHLPPTNLLHEVVQTTSVLLGTGSSITEPLDPIPPSPLAVILKLRFLAVVMLGIGADAEVDGDSWFHELESLKIITPFGPQKCVGFPSAENLQIFSGKPPAEGWERTEGYFITFFP